MDCRFSIFDWRFAVRVCMSPRLGFDFHNRQSAISNRQFVMLVYSLMSALAGCSLPHRTFTPPADPATMNDVTFIHYLSTVPTVTVGEATRATLLLVGETKQWPSFEEQWNELRNRKAVRDAWKMSLDHTLDKGTLAFMLLHVAKLPRGMTNVISDATGVGGRRYALKACIDAEVLPYSTAHEPVTGGELVTAIRRLEFKAGPVLSCPNPEP